MSIDQKTQRLIKRLLAKGEEAVLAYRDELGTEEAAGAGRMDDEEFMEAVGLVVSGCKPGEKYYKLVVDPEMTLESLLSAPGSSVLYSKSRAKLAKEWAQSLVLIAEGNWTHWDEMDEDQLEEWAERLDIEVSEEDSEE